MYTPLALLLLCLRRMIKYFLSIKTFFLPAAVVALLLAAAGCGSGSGSAHAETNAAGEIIVKPNSLSKAEFVEQADEICTEEKARLLKEIETFEQNGAQASEKATLAALSDLVAPTVEEIVDQLSSLGAPPGNEKEVGAFLDAIRQAVGEFEENPSLLGQLTPFGKAIKLAGKLGLTGCANSLGA